MRTCSEDKDMPIVPSSSLPPDLRAARADQASPLTPEHFAELARAEKRAGSLARAMRIASFNGWGLAIGAALTLLMGLFDVESIVLAALIGALAFNEFRGLKLLRAFDLRGPRVLGWNQVALMVLIVIYAIWKLATYKSGANAYEKEIKETPELGPILEPILAMYANMMYWFYIMLIGLGILYQGGNALYYFSRHKHLQAYCDETPEWVIQLKRTTGE